MLAPRNRIPRRTAYIAGALVFLGLLFLVSFWSDIGQVLLRILQILLALVGKHLAPFSDEERRAFNVVIFFNLLGGFGLVYLLWSILISAQALLPVEGPRDILRTAFHLLMYILRRHGPAVFVADGVYTASSEELRRHGRGVSVVDFNSALVLEEVVPPPSLTSSFENFRDRILVLIGLADPPQNPRACGPGIVFMRKHERIRTAVDLRKQFRLRPANLAYTRDGIELRANVWSLFTIGQDPDLSPIYVTYVGDLRAENLREVFVDSLPGDRIRIRFIGDFLEADDQREIHHWTWVDLRRGQMEAYVDPSSQPRLPVFDPNRVFSAAFSEARDDADEVIPWHGLPTKVGTDIFRRLLLDFNYDQLYGLRHDRSPLNEEQPPPRPEGLPLLEIRKTLRVQMRNNGLLSYRLLLTKDARPVEQGHEYSRYDLRLSPRRPLTSPHVLRTRGIRVIASGFGDLTPVSEAIYTQRLDNVLARWERETELVQASRELESIRVRSRARRQAQQELERAFTQIFEAREHSQEVLAIQVMQALENMSNNPNTRRLLPPETLELMNRMHNWLLPPSGGGGTGSN